MISIESPIAVLALSISPVGVRSRNFSNAKIYSVGWRVKVFLKEGIELTYPWVEAQSKALLGQPSIAVSS